MVINMSILGKRPSTAKVAMGFAAVCIAAILHADYHKPTQSQVMIFLSSSVMIPADKGKDTATPNPENSQIAAVPEPVSLNTAVEDSLSRWHTVRMRVTAYCPCKVCCGRFAKGRTANGYVIRRGDSFVAAPKKYTFGTEIIVPQYNDDKPIIVNDRGGAIKGNRLDVFFQSHAEATKWGIKYLDVKVRTSHQIN